MSNFFQKVNNYLLTTSFTSRKENKDIITGDYRPINLLAPPFSFPKPLKTIREEWPQENESYIGKSLLLWRVSDLPNR